MFKTKDKVDKLIVVQYVLFVVGWLTYVDVVDKINEMTNGAFYRTAEQEWKHHTELSKFFDTSILATHEEVRIRKLLNEQRKYLVEELRR